MKDNITANELDQLVTQLLTTLRLPESTPDNITAQSTKTEAVQELHSLLQPYMQAAAAKPVSVVQSFQGSVDVQALTNAPTLVSNVAASPLERQSSAVSASTPTPTEALTGEMGNLSAVLQEMKRVVGTQTDTLLANTNALVDSITQQKTAQPASTFSTAGSIISQVLGGGLGLVPLISGIMGLFKGSPSTPAPLTPFVLPPAVHLESGLLPTTQSSLADYSQNGLPRPASPVASSPQITLNVQAMDSKSFLDRSDDIAQAVKQALLYSHSLNDVVSDL
jgi:hypothetical protein